MNRKTVDKSSREHSSGVRILIGSLLMLAVLSFSFSQELAELSAKEKKRRADLKKKSSIVLTNANLNSLKGKAAVHIEVPEKKAPAEPQASKSESVAVKSSDPNAIVPEYTPPDKEAVTEAKAAAEAGETAESDAAEPKEKADPSSGKSAEIGEQNIQEKWMKAKELVELLTLKMNYLKHEFSSMDDMISRDHLLRQLDETLKKLEAAKREEEELRHKAKVKDR